MFQEEFTQLSSNEQIKFKRIVNVLLGCTYLLREVYSTEGNTLAFNADYRFVERHFTLLNDYFEYAGFRLERDSNYGVIALTSDFDYNRQKFDKLTTLILYTLRLVYEEGREEIKRRPEIFTTTGEVIHKMISLGILQKKPAGRDILESLRKLAKFNIIEKIEGKWEEATARFLILQSILFIVSSEKISNMYDLAEQDTNNQDDIKLESEEGEADE